jgi:hypothetical protein
MRHSVQGRVGRERTGCLGARNGNKQTETAVISACPRWHHDTLADSFAESYKNRPTSDAASLRPF